MPIDFNKQNERVQQWADRTEAGLKGHSAALGIAHRANSPSSGSSVAKIKGKTSERAGIIDRVSFKFPRALIWTHKGAGKGLGGLLGSVWYDALGIRHSTNPASLGKMGTGGRTAKPWLNDTLEAPTGIDELATIVAEESGDAIVNKLLIK